MATSHLSSTGPCDIESVIRWLQSTMEVLQSAAGDSDFFQKAAQAVVELVSLDSGRVVVREKLADWKTVAIYPPSGETRSRDDPASRLVLKLATLNKRTFWYDPLHQVASFEVSRPTDVGSSLAGVDSIVAAPILDQKGTVIAVLYGERRLNSIVATGKRISNLDAMLIDLLASGVGAGLARLEQERAALSFQTQLEQFFTPSLARQLTNRPELLNGQDLEISVLFCDIRGFSRISRNHGPTFTLEWTHDVLSTLSDCVLEHSSTLSTVHAATQSQSVLREGTDIEHGGKAPAREHLLHVLFEFVGGSGGGVVPRVLGEVNVTVPEAGSDDLVFAVDDLIRVRNGNFAALAPGRSCSFLP